jgi:ACT domain-containing protein
MTVGLNELKNHLNDIGEKIGLSIKIQHEDIFNAMHKI